VTQAPEDGTTLAGFRAQAIAAFAAPGQPQLAGHQRAGNIQFGSHVIAELALFLKGATHGNAGRRLVEVLLGNDIDHPTHGIGTIERGGRTTDHLDALNGIHGRNMVELVATEVVRVDVTMIILATPVDQDQGVIRAHTAHGNRGLAGLVAGFPHIHPFQLTHRIDHRRKRAAVQLLLTNHGNAGRSLRDLLFETGSGHHIDRFQLMALPVLLSRRRCCRDSQGQGCQQGTPW